jgi:FkbM family methyltransferase
MQRESSPKYCTLPNKMQVAYQSKAEVEYFYRDIFEKQIYLKNGITINPGDCIFDVGANIGLFSLFAHQKQRDVNVYIFEPAPPLFEIVRINTLLHGVNAKIFDCGLSNESKSAILTFYPKSSGMSSFYANEQEEKEILRAIMLNQLHEGVNGMAEIMPFVDDILTDRFQHETYVCQLKTLSAIIAENDVDRINLLKIDAQKSELDILEGIEDHHWEKVDQIVIEVHDLNERLNTIVEFLTRCKYEIVVEQECLYRGSNLYNLYAVRG